MEEAAQREQMLAQLAEQDRVDQLGAAARRAKCVSYAPHIQPNAGSSLSRICWHILMHAVARRAKCT